MQMDFKQISIIQLKSNASSYVHKLLNCLRKFSQFENIITPEIYADLLVEYNEICNSMKKLIINSMYTNGQIKSVINPESNKILFTECIFCNEKSITWMDLGSGFCMKCREFFINFNWKEDKNQQILNLPSISEILPIY